MAEGSGRIGVFERGRKKPKPREGELLMMNSDWQAISYPGGRVLLKNLHTHDQIIVSITDLLSLMAVIEEVRRTYDIG